MTLRISSAWLSRASLLVAVVAVSLATVTFVTAHGGNAALIHSCVRNVAGAGGSPPKGDIRIVGASDTCTSSIEMALDWNLQGVQGAPGPQGPQGVAGESGLANLELVRFVDQFGGNTQDTGAHSCPAGKKLISGSVSMSPTINHTQSTSVDASILFVHGWILSATAYGFGYRNTTAGTTFIHTQMLCA